MENYNMKHVIAIFGCQVIN